MSDGHTQAFKDQLSHWKWRALHAEEEVKDLRKSIENIRDAVLHQRHQLAENGMTNDQINDVLGVIDDNTP